MSKHHRRQHSEQHLLAEFLVHTSRTLRSLVARHGRCGCLGGLVFELDGEHVWRLHRDHGIGYLHRSKSVADLGDYFRCARQQKPSMTKWATHEHLARQSTDSGDGSGVNATRPDDGALRMDTRRRGECRRCGQRVNSRALIPCGHCCCAACAVAIDRCHICGRQVADSMIVYGQ